MEYFQQRARDRWLRRVKIKDPECKVHEIRGSGNDISHSKKTMRVDEAQAYIRADSDQPIFKLVQFKVGTWVRPNQEQHTDLIWVIDLLADLGVDAYSIESSLNMTGCNMVEQDLDERGKVLITVADTGYMQIIASYSYVTRSTTCLVFGRVSFSSKRGLELMGRYMMQNTRLYQDCHFLSLLLLDLFLDRINESFPAHGTDAWTRYDESNLHNFETMRLGLRIIEHDFCGVDDILNYLRTHIDPKLEQENSHTIPQENVGGDLDMKEMLTMMEQRVSLVKREAGWELGQNNDYMDEISRRLLREDTKASIKLSEAGVELSQASVELTKAAKVDSSSMKVIAVMTMVFLPGTFFAALFAVPSLDWKGDDVVGKNFWMYWAFTIPFTLLVIVLWLVITQRKQMRDAFETSKEQWLAKTKALQRRLQRKKPAADEEEVELNEVGQEGSGEEGR